MNETLEKVLEVLSHNKRKTVSGVVLVGLFSVVRYAKSAGALEKVLGKMGEKLQKQVEKNLKKKEKLAKMTSDFDEIYNHFLSLNRVIKGNLKRDITSIFDIETIKESLKSKNTTAEDRIVLWDEFKTEIFLHAIFSIIYISISKVILFIRECILNKHEGLLEGESEKNLQVLENFFSDFTEFIIRNSGKFLYTYLKERLKPILSKVQVTQKYGEIELMDLISNLCEVVTEIDEEGVIIDQPTHASDTDDETPYGSYLTFDEAIGETTFIDINGIGGLLGEERENEKKKSTKLENQLRKDRHKGELNFPQFKIRVLRAFTKTTESHRIVENIEGFLRYFYAAKNGAKGLIGIEELQEEEEEEKSDHKGVNGFSSKNKNYIKKNGVLIVNLEDEEESKENNGFSEHKSEERDKGADESKKRILKTIKVASDEFLDLIECGNFNLYGLYLVNYEFRKLSNRIFMYFNKRCKPGEKIALATFLPILHKIVNEEFIDESAEETNEVFYNSRIKSALAVMNNSNNSDKEVNPEEIYVNCRIMEELEMKKQVENGLKEFGKRIYMDKEFTKVQEINEAEQKNLEKLVKEIEK